MRKCNACCKLLWNFLLLSDSCSVIMVGTKVIIGYLSLTFTSSVQLCKLHSVLNQDFSLLTNVYLVNLKFKDRYSINASADIHIAIHSYT